MNVLGGVTKVQDGRPYVRRSDGRWQLFWLRSEDEKREGGGLGPWRKRSVEVIADFRLEQGTAGSSLQDDP